MTALQGMNGFSLCSTVMLMNIYTDLKITWSYYGLEGIFITISGSFYPLLLAVVNGFGFTYIIIIIIFYYVQPI